MKKGILFILCALIALPLLAITITGKIVDPADNYGMAGATVRLLKATKDSTLVKGASTDVDGYFWFTGVPEGKYVISVDYIGYKPLKKPVTVNKQSPNKMDMGEMNMETSSIMLKEATVVGVKTEIKVMQDTIEYNADSYKTQPNAVVEDLLKRLPGVEVGTDGKITSNGKEITKVLIDGKEFFTNDPKVGTKNIPVNIVDKVQVVDRKSDLARITGVDDGEEETVINLTVKKGMNNGWFGSVLAGYGTDDRYKGNFIVNRFQDGNQFTLLGGANNVNDMAFTNGAERFHRFGGVNGINTTQNIGANFNVGNGEKFRVGGNVMYSHSDQNTSSRSNKTYLFTDSTSTAESGSYNRDKSHNLTGDFRLRWEIDSCNTFEFRPEVGVHFNRSLSLDSTLTRAGDPLRTMVNNSWDNDVSKGTSYDIRANLIFNHKFKYHPGRSYSININYSRTNTNEDERSFTDNTYYLLDDPSEIIDQVNDNHSWNNSLRTRLTWTEPLGDIKNARFLTFSYRVLYKTSNADKMVYNVPTNSGAVNPVPSAKDASFLRILNSRQAMQYLAEKYGPLATRDANTLHSILEYETLGTIPEDAVLDSDLSNQFRNTFFTQDFQIGFKQVRSNYNLDAGFTVSPSMSKSENLINDAKSIPTRWVWNVAPYARLRFKMSKTRSLALDYRSRTSQPSMTQLQPVLDMSNPLRMVQGNPNLKPSFNQRFNIRYNDFDTKSQRSIMAMFNADYTFNSIVNKTTFNSQTGGQLTTYENVSGAWNMMAACMLNMPLRNKHFYFTMRTFNRYSSSLGYNNGELNRNGSLNLNIGPGMSYRTDWLELELRPNYTLQYSHNTVATSSNNTVHTYGGSFNGSYYTPFGLSFSTDLNYSDSKGYAAGYDSSQWLWNASMTYEFLKGRAASFSAKVYDILQQKKRISRSVTANYIQDSEYNSLTRYVMFSFAYKFNSFGGAKNIPQNNYGGFMDRGHGRRM